MQAERLSCEALRFALFQRSVHPELFTIVEQRSNRSPVGTVRLSLTTTGHLLEFQTAGLILTEVCAPAGHPLPTRWRLDISPAQGPDDCQIALPGGRTYNRECRVERLTWSRFWHRHQRVVDPRRTDALVRVFEPDDVALPGAASRLRVVCRPRRLAVESVHTFPADQTVIRSRTVVRTGTGRDSRTPSTL